VPRDDVEADPTYLVLPALSRAVAVEILVHGAQSRAQLAKRLGLSAPTLTRVVRPLLDTGVLVETDAVRTPGPGRSSLPLDIVEDTQRFVGVKLTSESIYGVVTDLRANVLHSETIEEPSLDVDQVVRAVADLVARLCAVADVAVTAVGVTVGGRVERGETVADSPFLHWHDVPFRTLLRAEVGLPLFLANDVTGLTKAHQWFGFGRTYSDFALLTVGAGVGYGLVINHEVVPTWLSPFSHFPVDPHGPLCPMGHRGCMTAYVTSAAVMGAVSQGHGRAVTYDEVLHLVDDGDPVARRVASEAAHALGRGVAAITCLTGVERIILSGEGAGLVEVAADSFRAGRTEYLYGAPEALDPVVMPMTFLEWARAAAAVAIQETFPSRSIDRTSTAVTTT
jgi:predicted NBD/HSP70 family sugar kinase